MDCARLDGSRIGFFLWSERRRVFITALRPGSFAQRAPRFRIRGRTGTIQRLAQINIIEVTKALAALKPLYGKGNVEIVTREGTRVRGIVRSMKTTQALTTPSVKVERADGQIVKVPFSAIVEIIDHNQ